MYLNYYGFSEKPFAITPNPRFIYFSTMHKEAFALLLYGINSRFGFIQLMGEVGTGKTTVLRTLLNQLNEETCRVALIFNPPASALDLLSAINREYGISPDGNIAQLLGSLNQFLLKENAAGRTVVLVIDEAQNLAPEVLEQIRLVSNLETDAEKLIQIILAGQPELGKLLEKPELRQISQRIALRYRLGPLRREDVKPYIEHRLDVVGGRGKVFFSAAAVLWLYRYSRGVPRVINVLCDRALLIAYTEDKRQITARIVALSFKDVMLKSSPGFAPAARWILAASLAIGVVVMAGYRYASLRPAAVTSAASLQAAPAPKPSKPGSRSPAAAVASSVEVKDLFRDHLPLLDRSKTSMYAFNAVAPLWDVPPIKGLTGNGPALKELSRLVTRRKLEMTAFRGTLDELIALDLPALLAIPVGKGNATILLAVTGISDDRVAIAPPILARNSFTRSELASVWRGRAYLVWRNSRNIPLAFTPGAAGQDINRLQDLLRDAGLSVNSSGIYDEGTARVIRDFQVSKNIEATGVVDAVTLIQLYRAAADTSFPRLSHLKKAGRS